jgi:hypothetical protein
LAFGFAEVVVVVAIVVGNRTPKTIRLLMRQQKVYLL